MACHHSTACIYPSPDKPTDPSSYANGIMKRLNMISISYIETNLQIDSSDTIFIAATFRKFLLFLLAVLHPYEPVTVMSHPTKGWAVHDRNMKDITHVALWQCAKVLVQKDTLTTMDSEIEALTDTDSEDEGWTIVPEERIVLKKGFIDLQSVTGRQILYSFLGLSLLKLWEKAGEDVLVRLVGPGTDDGRRYFV